MTDVVDQVDAREVTILVVDDDPDMRVLARMVLERAGISVAGEAADGPQALRLLDEFAPPPVPTVVLLDNQMPGPSGLEVAERILADRPDQLIVIFSAYLSADVVDAAERIGVTACVSKTDAMDLAGILMRVLADHR